MFCVSTFLLNFSSKGGIGIILMCQFKTQILWIKSLDGLQLFS